MARSTGTFTFPANFEVEKAAPLDARVATGLKTDLVSLPFPYKGMIVSVTDDTADNNGTYVLNDADGSVADNWGKVAGTTVTDLDYSGNLLTITMSDGSVHTTVINTASSSTTTPTGQPGASSLETSINSVAGTLSFSSRSEQ